MKIGTLTYHDTRNFGAVLQAYALQKSLENLGVESEIINYKSDFLTEAYRIKTINQNKSPKEFIKWILTVKNDKKSKEKFDYFNKNYQNISERTYSKNTIVQANSEYDSFIVGSDQVWNLNLNGNDTTYLLDFVDDNRKKNSYAASFGYKEIPKQFLDITRKQISEFNNVSTREQQGKTLIEKYTSKDSSLVLDPTLLLEKKDWQKISKKNKYMECDYILVYSIASTPTLFSFARKLAKEKNCKIIYINRSYKYKTGMKNIRDASPEEFLGYIENAKYIVTSSFHGVVFAMNYEKEFFYELDIKPQNNNSRLESIIDITNLKDREIINADNKSINNRINYEYVNKILKKERNYSIDFIKSIIEQ